jgi:hypothetical protein
LEKKREFYNCNTPVNSSKINIEKGSDERTVLIHSVAEPQHFDAAPAPPPTLLCSKPTFFKAQNLTYVSGLFTRISMISMKVCRYEKKQYELLHFVKF